LSPDEVSEVLTIYLLLPATLGPGVYSASNRNEYHKKKNVFGEKSADSLIAICESTV
jgi:hypothetical protein